MARPSSVTRHPLYNRTVRCAILLLAAVALACAAEKANKNVEDHLIKLNVAAVDPQGDPVAGLQSSDFQVTEDGKAQKIVFFRFGGESKPLQVADHEYSNRATPPVRPTVVLLDLLNDRLLSGSMMGTETSRFLESLESSEGIYLYLLTVSGAIYPIHPMPAAGAEIPSSAEPWTKNIAPVLDQAIKKVFSLHPVDDRDIKNRFDMTMKALLSLGGEMQQFSGRRNLVWVSHGVPLVGPSISEQAPVDFTVPLRRICERLADAQVVVYNIQQSASGAAEAIGAESQMTIDEITSDTGGRAYRSGRIGDAVHQAISDSRGNYQLAYYTPATKIDSKHHKIKVVCSHKDVHLQTVQGFYSMQAPPVEAEVDHLALATAAHSAFDQTAIGLRASVSADSKFSVHIDASDLYLRPQGDSQHAGKIAVLFAAYESASKMDQAGEPYQFDLKFTDEQYEKVLRDGIALNPSVPIGPAVKRVRVIVLDEGAGSVGSVTVPIQH
jgi:VWFA-related protein